MMYAASFSMTPSTCQLGIMGEVELLEKMREFQDMKWGKDMIEDINKLGLLIVFAIIFYLINTLSRAV